MTVYVQKSLQDLRNSSSSTLENVFSTENDDDDSDGHEENTRSIDRIDEDDTDDDEDENRFYYKTPGKQFKTSNEGLKMSRPVANGVGKKLSSKGGTKHESSLIRYVLPQNTLSPLAINFDSVSAASFQSGK